MDDGGHLPPFRNHALVGHAAAERTLLDAYRAGRLHHAWLIGGPAGIGKATLAWRFARFVLAHPDPRAPEVRAATSLAVPPGHPAAQRIAAGSHGDVVTLRREWNDKTRKLFSEIRVDDVRRALGLFQTAAAAGGYRVCLIDTAEDLNRSSANALLKLIEEPPPRSLFLVLAHRPGQVMPTLVSRCRRLVLAGLRPDEVAAAVQAAGVAVPEAEIVAAAGRAGGSVGATLRFLDQDAADLDRAVRTGVDRLPAVDWRAVHRLADLVGTSDERFDRLVEALFDHLAGQVHAGAGRAVPAASLARLAVAWERVRAQAREAAALNLDKRPALLGMVGDLADAAGG